MTRLRVAIVDDEPLARARLRRLLGVHADIDIVGDYADGQALIDAWPQQPADLLFADVQMPEIDGFAAIDRLHPPCRHTVFVTAYAEHAVQAFAVGARDYLVKPVAPERLALSLDRARAAVGDSPATQAYPTRMALPLGRRSHLVDVDDIDCIVAQANYVEVRAGTRRFVLRRPLTSLLLEFDPAKFVRVHRSIVVRSAAVAAIDPLASGRFRLRLRDGAHVVSGRSYREVVRGVFGLANTP